MSDNFIRFYGYKNINKPKKAVKFDEWTAQEYYVDPIGIDWIDPRERTINLGDNVVFKLYNDSEMKAFLKKIER